MTLVNFFKDDPILLDKNYKHIDSSYINDILRRNDSSRSKDISIDWWSILIYDYWKKTLKSLDYNNTFKVLDSSLDMKRFTISDINGLNLRSYYWEIDDNKNLLSEVLLWTKRIEWYDSNYYKINWKKFKKNLLK